MSTIEYLESLKSFATKYRQDAAQSIVRNAHMNERTTVQLMNQKDIDAVLADFINFIGVRNGVDFGLYTSDFHSEGPYIIK